MNKTGALLLFTENLLDKILLEPVRQGADSLKVVAGYATHTMASWHIQEIAKISRSPINISLICGMAKRDGINEEDHAGFNNIITSNGKPMGAISNRIQSNLTCQYVFKGLPVHSKLYLWEKEATPFSAFMGSANYTQSAFFGLNEELIQECDFRKSLRYFQEIESRSIYCNHSEVEEFVQINTRHREFQYGTDTSPIINGDFEKITLSLLTSTGDVGYGSGINWGHRRDGTKRDPNQAYISVPARVKKSGFFPPKKHHFSVLTDDHKHMILSVQQDGDKAITTPLNNAHLGEYIRYRMRVENGVYVTKSDLERYGRLDIDFYKLDEEHYFMDFSVL